MNMTLEHTGNPFGAPPLPGEPGTMTPVENKIVLDTYDSGALDTILNSYSPIYQTPCADETTKNVLRNQSQAWVTDYEQNHNCKIDWGNNPPSFMSKDAPTSQPVSTTERTVPVTPQSPMGIFSSESDPTQAPPTATPTATSESIGQDNGLQNNIGVESSNITTADLVTGGIMATIVTVGSGWLMLKKAKSKENKIKRMSTGVVYQFEDKHAKDGTRKVRNLNNGKLVTSTDTNTPLGKAHAEKHSLLGKVKEKWKSMTSPKKENGSFCTMIINDGEIVRVVQGKNGKDLKEQVRKYQEYYLGKYNDVKFVNYQNWTNHDTYMKKNGLN